ncbi:ETX/MTX2 family pore-forming toxin [Bacillus toyonensis]|uniref:Pesticidal protein n=1 Tax=Bacillus toyonensis TaxID=155322 RepID=A0A2B7V2Z3_9BACI|nr:ETX/MTX2 family pore-forming toxin [Bacillus toyonensis]PEO44245.1 hypothetical protein CN579_32615 [Bacillus toyonensis]PGG78661.1 hypothetical protein CON73_31195 [Bacillus toyonensis]
MAIFNFDAKVVEFINWWTAEFGGKDPRNIQIGYENRDINVVPSSSNPSVNVIPKLARSSVQELQNNTSVTQTQELAFSETTTESQSSTTTHGASFSTTVTSVTQFTAEVNFKAIGSSIEQTIGVSMTGEYNYSSSLTKTTEKSRSWILTQPVVVPPFSRVTCTLLIYNAPFSVPVDLNCNVFGTLGGDFLASYTYTVISTGRTVNTSITASQMTLTSWPGKPSEIIGIAPKHGLIFKGTGTQAAVNGLYSTVKFVESPLPGHQGEKRTYYLPAQPVNEDDLISSVFSNIPIINPVSNL